MAHPKDIGIRIRQLRIEAGLKQEELADLVGVSRVATVSDWERGLMVPPADRLRSIAEACGVTPVDAFGAWAVDEVRNGVDHEKQLLMLRDPLPIFHGMGATYTTGGDSDAEGGVDVVRPKDELDQWLETVEHTVRFAGGTQNLTPEERRETQRDVLTGMIRLGKAEGKDVRRLEEMLRDLGVAPSERRISVADVYELYREDVAAARERAVGLKELAIAARIAEEEGVRRNERLERMERTTAAQPALSTREMMDLDAAEAAGREPLPAKEEGNRGTG